MGFFNWAAPFMQRYGERWTDEDVRDVEAMLAPTVGAGSRILDLGGGTGGLAVRLADSFNHCVTILDVTPEMTAQMPEHGSVEIVIGDAAAMPFEDDRFDGLLAFDAFHHFRDQSKAVEEMHRVVRPRGRIVVGELDRSRLVIKLIGIAERIVREPAAFLTPDEMCAFMRERGIQGKCRKTRNASYVFIGTVE